MFPPASLDTLLDGDPTGPPEPLDAGILPVESVFLDTLAYARDRAYVGWDYADGMSSRLRRWLPFEHHWLNLAFQESAKRSPVNIRPLLLVERRRNFMGAGLFAMANLRADRFVAAGDVGTDVDFREETRFLLDWLVQRRCRGYSGFCGSHQHEIETLSGTSETTIPSIVSTAFPARALLRAGDIDPVYPAVGRTAADFVVEDLCYREGPAGATVKYLPADTGEYVTPNAMAIGAQLLLDVHDRFGHAGLRERATKVLDYVATLQQPSGGWMYRHPPESSHLSMDNFHNGFILEAYLRHAAVVDGRFDDVIDDGLAFYGEVLFDADGAPNWDESSTYPRDVHAVAQGILVYTYAGDLGRARRVLAWALENLYAGGGRFYFRRGRLYTNRTTLMRWCQAWMAFAMGEFLARREGTVGAPDRSAERAGPPRPFDVAGGHSGESPRE